MCQLSLFFIYLIPPIIVIVVIFIPIRPFIYSFYFLVSIPVLQEALPVPSLDVLAPSLVSLILGFNPDWSFKYLWGKSWVCFMGSLTMMVVAIHLLLFYPFIIFLYGGGVLLFCLSTLGVFVPLTMTFLSSSSFPTLYLEISMYIMLILLVVLFN